MLIFSKFFKFGISYKEQGPYLPLDRLSMYPYRDKASIVQIFGYDENEFYFFFVSYLFLFFSMFRNTITRLIFINNDKQLKIISSKNKQATLNKSSYIIQQK